MAEGGETGSRTASLVWWQRPAGWLKAAATTGTALGLVTYSVLRVDYALFYRRFGLRPEDVGLGQAELISQSLSGVVVVLAILFLELLLFGILALFIWGLGREIGLEVRDFGRRYGTVAALGFVSTPLAPILGWMIGGTFVGPWVLLATGPLALWWLFRLNRLRDLSTGRALATFDAFTFTLSMAFRLSPQWAIVSVLLLAGTAAVVERASRRRARTTTASNPARASAETSGINPQLAHPSSPAGEGSGAAAPAPERSADRAGPSPTAGRVIFIATAIVTVVLVELLLASQAVSDAKQVREGRAVEPTFLGIPLVSWGAHPVGITWTGEAPPGLDQVTGHCLLYLGQGNGAVLLYDHDTGMTIRVPSGALVLSIRPAANYALVCKEGSHGG
jgi:hypothetical protein